MISKQRKYTSPHIHTIPAATEYTFRLVSLYIFGFPYYITQTLLKVHESEALVFQKYDRDSGTFGNSRRVYKNELCP